MLKEWSLEFQSRFLFARTGVIVPGSLADSIELLSDSKYTPSIQDYVNLIVRYAVVYLWWSSIDTVTNEVSQRVLAKLVIPSFRSHDEQSIIEWSEYQLRMLFDIWATVEVIRDIIERKIDTNTKWYTGIDLGTGTGITLLAQYIQARRNGYKHGDIRNLGIEVNAEVIQRVKWVLDSFDFWTIVYWNTMNPSLYSGSHIHKVNFVTNEQLPYPWMPYSYLQKKDRKNGDIYNTEPFFYNIDALLSGGVDVNDANLFPSLVENQLLKARKSFFSKWMYAIAFTSEKDQEVDFSERDPWMVKKINPHILQTFLTPKRILIWGQMVSLSKVWNQYYMDNHEMGRPNDYEYTEQQVLSEQPLSRGRWNPSAISGVISKIISISWVY